jgi:hypothetical protein
VGDELRRGAALAKSKALHASDEIGVGERGERGKDVDLHAC